MKPMGCLALVALLCAGLTEAAELQDRAVDPVTAEELATEASTDLTRSLDAKVARKLDREVAVIFYDAVSKTALTVGVHPVAGAYPVDLPVGSDRR